MAKIYFITPSFKPYGGIIKIMDYLLHMRENGFDCILLSPTAFDDSSVLWNIPRFDEIRDNVKIIHPHEATIQHEDVIFFSLPSNISFIRSIIPDDFDHRHIVHMIQGVRHVDPYFQEGGALNLLHRSISRIAVSNQVSDAIERYTPVKSKTEVAVLGHNIEFFSQQHTKPSSENVINVGYTTWKGDLGKRIEKQASDLEPIQGKHFNFVSIDGEADWYEIRELYQSVDVFLATPLKTEGFYMPGLEAMAAGCILITPDAKGNRAYCDFGRNCKHVAHNNVNQYITQLKWVANATEVELLNVLEQAKMSAAKHNFKEEKKNLLNYYLSIVNETKMTQFITNGEVA